MAKNNTDLIAMGEDWFKKAPALPVNGREGLVIAAPWIALIFGVLGILTGLGGLGVLSLLSPLGLISGVHGSGMVLVSAALFIVSSVIMLMAYPGLKAKQYRGWMMLFWAEVVSVVSNLVTFNIIGAIIGGLIGFYLLYQVKSYYK